MQQVLQDGFTAGTSQLKQAADIETDYQTSQKSQSKEVAQNQPENQTEIKQTEDVPINSDKQTSSTTYYSTIEHIFKQLINVLIFLDTKHYMHRDLKPDNIMITKELQIKLIDFGFCREDTQQVNTAKTGYVGTPAYMAPEVHFENETTKKIQYSSKIDVWSTGVILYQMLYGYLPFIQTKIMRFEQLQLMKCLLLPGDLFGKIEVDEKFPLIIQACLQFDPQKRATPQELMGILANELQKQNTSSDKVQTIPTVTKQIGGNQIQEFTVKVVLVGSFGVGKTTLIKQFTQQQQDKPIVTKSLLYKNKYSVILEFHDTQQFEQQNNYKRNIKYTQIIKNANICFLVYSNKNKQSLQDLKVHKQLIEKNSKNPVFCCICNNFTGKDEQYSFEGVKPELCSVVSKDQNLEYVINAAVGEWIRLNGQ